MDLSIIVVNYNTQELLAQCLESIYRKMSHLNYEILVVDNASSDGSADMVKQRFPEVKLIENHKNLGFATANNQALRQAEGKHILLLNSDTIALPSTVEMMRDFISHNPMVGAVGCKILNPDFTVEATARRFPRPLNALFGRKSVLTKLFPKNRFSGAYLACLNVNSEIPFEVDWVSAACMMVKREIIEEVGLLDEDFFMYWEDADWCYRIKAAGWKIYYVPGAQIIHLEGASSNGKDNKLIIEFHKSVFLYYRKHYLKSVFNPMYLPTVTVLTMRTGILLVANMLKRTYKELVRTQKLVKGDPNEDWN